MALADFPGAALGIYEQTVPCNETLTPRSAGGQFMFLHLCEQAGRNYLELFYLRKNII